jgi:hypothetical protein
MRTSDTREVHVSQRSTSIGTLVCIGYSLFHWLLVRLEAERLVSEHPVERSQGGCIRAGDRS